MPTALLTSDQKTNKQKPATDTQNNTEYENSTLTLAQTHLKLIAKAGYVAIDCCESARLIPHVMRPCARAAHTTFVLAKVYNSPVELQPKVQNFSEAFRTAIQTQTMIDIYQACQQLYGVTNNLKDIYKLLTKTKLLEASAQLKQSIELISAVGMLVTFGSTLGRSTCIIVKNNQWGAFAKPICAADGQEEHLTKEQRLKLLGALAYFTSGLLIVDQFLSKQGQHQRLLPWLSACTVACAILSVYSAQGNQPHLTAEHLSQSA